MRIAIFPIVQEVEIFCDIGGACFYSHLGYVVVLQAKENPQRSGWGLFYRRGQKLLSDFTNAFANIREGMLADAEGHFIMLMRGGNALLQVQVSHIDAAFCGTF